MIHERTILTSSTHEIPLATPYPTVSEFAVAGRKEAHCNVIANAVILIFSVAVFFNEEMDTLDVNVAAACQEGKHISYSTSNQTPYVHDRVADK